MSDMNSGTYEWWESIDLRAGKEELGKKLMQFSVQLL